MKTGKEVFAKISSDENTYFSQISIPPKLILIYQIFTKPYIYKKCKNED